MPGFFPPIIALVSVLLLSIIIVRSRDRHQHVTARRCSKVAVQAMHQAPTPQIGGVALFGGLVLGLCAMAFTNPASAWIGALLMVAGLPVFITGLMEDVGEGARPAVRLLAAFIAAAAALALTGMPLTHGGFAGGDALLTVLPFAVAFTLLSAAGAVHAFNLIDGIHGLAIGISIVIAATLLAMSVSVGDTVVTPLVGLVLAALVGIFLVNYPRGHIFLGDMGAYGIGHVLTWIAMVLLYRNPEISPWAMLLVFFWPIIETVFTMVRRKITRRPFGQPDKLHFHHVVLRLLENRWLGRGRRWLANPATTLLLLPAVCVIGFMGYAAMRDTGMALGLLGATLALYSGTYLVLHRLNRRSAVKQGRTRRRQRMTAAATTVPEAKQSEAFPVPAE